MFDAITLRKENHGRKSRIFYIEGILYQLTIINTNCLISKIQNYFLRLITLYLKQIPEGNVLSTQACLKIMDSIKGW